MGMINKLRFWEKENKSDDMNFDLPSDNMAPSNPNTPPPMDSFNAEDPNTIPQPNHPFADNATPHPGQQSAPDQFATNPNTPMQPNLNDHSTSDPFSTNNQGAFPDQTGIPSSLDNMSNPFEQQQEQQQPSNNPAPMQNNQNPFTNPGAYDQQQQNQNDQFAPNFPDSRSAHFEPVAQQQPVGQQQQQPMGQQPQEQAGTATNELVLAKLEMLKVMIENTNQRIGILEETIRKSRDSW